MSYHDLEVLRGIFEFLVGCRISEVLAGPDFMRL